MLGGLLLSPLVVIWPACLLAEALTLSALLFFCSACLAYDAGKRFVLPVVGLFCCLLVFVRDPMIFFVWIFASLLATNVLLVRGGRRFVTIAGLVILLIAGSLGYARATFFTQNRYLQTFVNVVQLRILPDPEHREFFAARGLPTSSVVMERSGHPAWVDNAVFMPDDEVSPDFAAYRNWMSTQGPRTYITFLLTHPGYVLRSIFYSPNRGQYGGDFNFITGTTGWYLAEDMGFSAMNFPQYAWVAASLVLVILMSIQGIGYLLPTSFRVCLELQKDIPDDAIKSFNRW